MTTKITIDPTLVREIVLSEKYQDAKILIHPDSIEITSPDKDCEWDVYEDLAADLDYCGYFEGSCFIDIHRFKDMAIEWCAEKGWTINTSRYENRGLITMSDKEFANPPELFWVGKDKDYSDMLSAELAAIDWVYKQRQKEKKDE